MSETFMKAAFEQAQMAYDAGEVPVGAIIVKDGTIIAQAHNRTERDKDPTAHAEILVIQSACKELGDTRLPDCDMYVTLEPCPMCATAISFARIRRLYFAAFDPKSGGVDHGPKIYNQPTCHHKPEVIGGIEEEQGRTLLQKFFTEKR